MILGTKVGDIRDPTNRDDIIIAMNTTFSEPSALGRPFVKDKILANGPLALGAVVTYDYDGRGRQLHMVVCHHMEPGGWVEAPRFLRWGLDYLWHECQRRTGGKFSIVNVGTGEVGLRMKAPYPQLLEAITASHLEMTLWLCGSTPMQDFTNPTPLRPLRSWARDGGVREIREINVAL